MAEIICQKSRTFVVNWNYLAEFTHFCRELIIIDKIHRCCKDVTRIRMSPGCFRGVSRVFLASFTHKIVINKLIIMSKNPALSQKVLEDLLRLQKGKNYLQV